MNDDAATLPLAVDMIEGIAAIAEFGGWTKRRANYLAERRLIPVFKVGRIWCATKSGLKAHFAKLENGLGR